MTVECKPFIPKRHIWPGFLLLTRNGSCIEGVSIADYAYVPRPIYPPLEMPCSSDIAYTNLYGT